MQKTKDRSLWNAAVVLTDRLWDMQEVLHREECEKNDSEACSKISLKLNGIDHLLK